MQRKAGTDEPDLFETKLRVAEPVSALRQACQEGAGRSHNLKGGKARLGEALSSRPRRLSLSHRQLGATEGS